MPKNHRFQYQQTRIFHCEYGHPGVTLLLGGLLKPFEAFWWLFGVSRGVLGLSWPFWSKMQGCPKPSFAVLKKSHFHCGHGQILGAPPLEGLLKSFGGSWCLSGALWGKWRGAQNRPSGGVRGGPLGAVLLHVSGPRGAPRDNRPKHPRTSPDAPRTPRTPPDAPDTPRHPGRAWTPQETPGLRPAAETPNPLQSRSRTIWGYSLATLKVVWIRPSLVRVLTLS